MQSRREYITAPWISPLLRQRKSLSNFISGVLLTIAIGVTVITGAIMGLNFITQSIEEKAKVKESMVPWVIGIIVSFGAFTIWEVAVNLFQSL